MTDVVTVERPGELSLPGAFDLTYIWDSLGGPLTRIVLILIGAFILRWIAHRLIDRVVQSAADRNAERLTQMHGRAGRLLADATGIAHARHQKRTATMGAILRSITTIVVFGIAILTVMSIVGIPLAPLLASAGVGGVALGFGAQSLVKDFLSGIFMIVEDQYGVGDVVDTGTVSGTVEDVTLRVTRIRDADGVVWYVRNGEILRLGNKSQGWSTALVDVQVGYDEDLAKVIRVIGDVIGHLGEAEPWSALLLEEPSVVGVESMSGGYVTLRVSAKCVANENFGVQRELRERIKQVLDEHHITVPGPMPPYSGGLAAPRP